MELPGVKTTAMPPCKPPKVKDDGMTLRDYFAAKSLQGLLAAPYQPVRDQHILARDAYTISDAMLAAREVQK